MESQTSFLQWKIENFSCLNVDMHGKCIRSPKFFFSYRTNMELYPNGLSGLEEHLMVRFRVDNDYKCTGGDLSLTASDGSLICKQHVRGCRGVNDLPLQLTFEDIVIMIKRKEAVHEDELTLQFCLSNGSGFEQRVKTSIDVLKISLGVDKKLLENMKPNEQKGISFLTYSKNDDPEGLYFKALRRGRRFQLILEPTNKKEHIILVDSCMSIVNQENSLVRQEENKHMFSGKKQWTFSDSLYVSHLKKKGTSLLIRIKIINGETKTSYNNLIYEPRSVHMTPNNNTSSAKEKPIHAITSNLTENSLDDLSNELMCLYQDHDFSDFRLKCGSVSFPVHQSILSVRSPVFKCMLLSGMTEAASGCMDIVDLDVPTLAHFLAFLYTGRTGNLEGGSALELYYAADKYHVPSLKRECRAVLCDSVAISNVCDVLSLANKHQDEELTSAARRFILDNFNEVSRSRQWQHFMKVDPSLLLETVTIFAANGSVLKRDPSLFLEGVTVFNCYGEVLKRHPSKD